jgi:hypothetical protein
MTKRNGKYMPPNVIAHLEYFMNTLNLDYKSQTENPFENPTVYPALNYKGAVEAVCGGSDVIMESEE